MILKVYASTSDPCSWTSLIIGDRGHACGLIETYPRFPFYTLTGLMGTNIMELIYLTDE